MEVQMKTYTVKLYEGVSREKVNETLKYYPDYFGKISIITNVINNKLQLTLKAFEGINVITANDLMIKIVERLKASQLVEKHNLDLLTV